MATQKRRTVGETLEASPSSSKLSQLNIIGSTSGGSGATTGDVESNQKAKSSGPKIIEISADGTFEIPDEAPDDMDEPPDLDLSMEGVSSISSTTTNRSSAVAGNTNSQEEEGPSVMEEMMAAADAARKVVKDKAEAEEKRVKKEFGGGLKKGFFNSAPAKGKTKAKKTTATSSKPIETIKPKPQAASTEKKDKLVLDEVQQAMKSSASPMSKLLSDGEWMTPDLLQKFATNPKLARGLSDPRFQAAISEMQKDPKAAMAKFQHDKELSEFLQEFFSTMGDHFTKIGEKKKQVDNKAGKSPQGTSNASKTPIKPQQAVERPLSDAAMRKAATSAPTPPSPQEQAQMNEILKNEELRELLMDPEMQKVMMSCSQPGRLQYVMADPKWGPKIRTLAKYGLVKIET